MRNFKVLGGILAENDHWSGLEDRLVRFKRNKVKKQIRVFKIQQGLYVDKNNVIGQFKTDYASSKEFFLYNTFECDREDIYLLLGFFETALLASIC